MVYRPGMRNPGIVLLLAGLALPVFAQVREIDSPAAAGSAEPSLARGADGAIYLSWIEIEGGARHAFRFSRTRDGSWTEPRTIARGDNWFVNWADVPSMAAGESGTLAAHWLEKVGAGTYAYGIRLSTSTDGGETWRTPFWLHADGTETEHGFVSLVPRAGGRFVAVWLDGRAMTEGADGEGEGDMSLRAATFGTTGGPEGEALIDARVCECCPTSAASLPDGTFALVYRDRSEGEVRDVSIAFLRDAAWSAPRTLHADDWKIDG